MEENKKENIADYKFDYSLDQIFIDMYDELKAIVNDKNLTEQEKYKRVKSRSGFYGAIISALKKSLLSDFIVFTIRTISEELGQSFSYHTAQNLISIFLNRTIDNKKVLAVFANTETKKNDKEEFEIVKKKRKRTAKNKIEIDYNKISKIYFLMVDTKIKLFDESFKHSREFCKLKYSCTLTENEEKLIKKYAGKEGK